MYVTTEFFFCPEALKAVNVYKPVIFSIYSNDDYYYRYGKFNGGHAKLVSKTNLHDRRMPENEKAMTGFGYLL